MKYVITGGAGHISGPITKALLKAGHEVRVIGRNEDHLREVKAQGAETIIGTVEDAGFLSRAFAGADVVYTMIPPNFDTRDLKGYIAHVGKNYADAIRQNKIKFVLNKSYFML